MTELTGVTTALLTPFKNGEVDFKSFERLLDNQLHAGIKSLVVLGTTAENVLLNPKEKKRLLCIAVKKARKKAKIFAGVGNPSTKETLDMALQARKLGVDGLLVVTPYYAKSTDMGLVEHYKTLQNATKLPIVVYNVRQRTGFDISPKVLKNLTDSLPVAALKETTASMSRVRSIAKKCPDLAILCGADDKLQDYLEVDSTIGIVSVLSNCLPQIAIDAFDKQAVAVDIFNEFAQALKCEVSPVAAKYLAFKLRLVDTCEMRLPLTPLELNKQQAIDHLVEKYGGQLK